ncbi:zinc finger BED-type containing 5 [Chelydra serpentina]|uniref:Zinc finger BED-type containing 5 n=1 Tax=Chelydra serpentina TaxID=8475 RepID=A0A8T1S904_CHESE|nr:zinc finger BED-type containing 5 [Chelydra serpentina]
MGSDHENLLYHTDVRWISRGKELNRVVELKDELRIFLLQKDKCSKFADLFCDDKWLSVVCYLADIFEKINTLNLSLQGKDDVLTMSEKVIAFQKKLVLWREHFENGCLEMFPSLCDFVAENDISVSPIKTLISAHLKNLETEFSNLFKNLPNEEFQWVLNPFVKNINMQHLLISLQEQLIDIREDGNLLPEFQQKPLHNWWMGLKNEYHDLVSTVNDALLPFGSTYLCEVFFSALTAIKTKYRNKLNLEPDL